MLGEVRRADQAHFLARPRGEQHAAPERDGVHALRLVRERAGEFEQGRRAAGVVVRAGMDLAFLVLAREAAGLAVPEVIVVRADDDILARAHGRNMG